VIPDRCDENRQAKEVKNKKWVFTVLTAVFSGSFRAFPAVRSHGIQASRHKNSLPTYHTIHDINSFNQYPTDGQLGRLPIQFELSGYNIPVSDRGMLVVNEHSLHKHWGETCTTKWQSRGSKIRVWLA
jgi:hypothetical protein